MEKTLERIEKRLDFIEQVVLGIDRRVAFLVKEEQVEMKAEIVELGLLEKLSLQDVIDRLGLHLDGVKDKPPAQVLGAQGVAAGPVMAPAALPPDLEKRLAVVGDPLFQQYCQTACDHGMDDGEHPVKQAARVILSLCCVSTPYALAEPEPAERLNAMFARFEAWKEVGRG